MTSPPPDDAAYLAALLLDLAEQHGDRVPRAEVRTAWIADDPAAGRARPVADPRRVGRQRGDHRRATKGTAAKAQVLRWLTWLERNGGAVRRDGDDVVLVDRAMLARLAAD